MLLDWYYTLWVDCIIRFRSIPTNKDDWKYKSILLMTMAMALQLGLIITLLKMYIFHSNFYDIDIKIFPGEKLNNFLNGFILYILPPLMLNYFLIFFNKRYESLTKKYHYHNGKYATTYMIGTFIFMAFLAISIFIYQSITM